MTFWDPSFYPTIAWLSLMIKLILVNPLLLDHIDQIVLVLLQDTSQDVFYSHSYVLRKVGHTHNLWTVPFIL